MKRIVLLMLVAILSVSVVTAQQKNGINKRKTVGTHKQTNSTASSGTKPSASYSNGVLSVNGITYKMIYVDGGTFQMGATPEQDSDDIKDNEKPVHSVTLSSYYIGETEVTQGLWEAVMGNNPAEFKGSNRPVDHVSWNDCQIFISKLNSLTGRNFRLPTEAEWEFAARGGNKSRGYKYSGSNNIDNVAWYTKTTNDVGTCPVATKSPNELGIYDMSGNIFEWCSDWYEDYRSSSQTNPHGAKSGSFRVCRGGCWGDSARFCHSTFRGNCSPERRRDGLGLRLSE